jgi:hypothetical protein
MINQIFFNMISILGIVIIAGLIVITVVSVAKEIIKIIKK